MHPGAPAGPPYPYPPTPPPRPPRPAGHLTAGVLWLVAAALAVGALFADIYVTITPSAQVFLSFWSQHVVTTVNNVQVGPDVSVLLGVTVVVAVVALLGAGLIAFASRRKWAAVVAGALATGLMSQEALSMAVRPATPDLTLSLRPGWWLIVAAGLVAVVGFVISLVARPARRYAPPPPPAPAPAPQRWEPPTPRYGVPVQQAPEEPTPPPAENDGNEK